jgi:NOL1/NOP2/fmu family ribosome biogenesis protein
VCGTNKAAASIVRWPEDAIGLGKLNSEQLKGPFEKDA